MRELLEKYIGTLANAMRAAEVTDRTSKRLTLESGLRVGAQGRP